MRYQFTPAAERALAAAADWSSCAGNAELDAPEALLGLLSEPECRAALILAQFDIDESAVRRRFSRLAPVMPPDPGRANRFSAGWVACLDAAENRLSDYPRPLFLATEHLLLGIAASNSEVAAWLAEQGLHADSLEAEVHRLSGHQSGPLPIDSDDAGDFEPVAEPASTARRDVAHSEARPPDRVSVMRIVDAAANRASEGLRVIEDYLRFVLDDRHLTSQCKGIRHELTAALEAIETHERHAARETQADVGTQLSVPAEQARRDALAVAEANFKRVEQSLRSLEEYSKILRPKTAATLEQLRYRVYTLERATTITERSIERLADAKLYVLTDACSSAEALNELAAGLVAVGVDIIQLRDKTLADRELVERARRLRALTLGTRTLLIMNDRPDLAVRCGADGVHVGQEDLAVRDVRRILGSDGLIGVSTHSIEQARAAVFDGADYIGVGPTFPSGTKDFSQFAGPELIRSVSAEIRLPAFAIGGITLDNLPRVVEAGATRVAGGGAITSASDPRLAARNLLAALKR